MEVNWKISVALFMVVSSSVAAQSYIAPPTSSTRSHVPVISDEKMEQCVKLYNEAEWLSEKIDQTQVDNFNQESVDNYNQMVNEHSRMTDQFNAECAGKQSRSACEAAKKLNISQGLPFDEC